VINVIIVSHLDRAIISKTIVLKSKVHFEGIFSGGNRSTRILHDWSYHNLARLFVVVENVEEIEIKIVSHWASHPCSKHLVALFGM